MNQVLAIETSCDDTSVALVRADGFVVNCISADQDRFHREFGGIVPEIASRHHTEFLLPLIDQLLDESRVHWSQIDGIAVTNRPGLLGSLMVGLVTAKTLSLAKNLPFVGINHLEGHILAPFLYDDKIAKPDLHFPFLALTVSGGHSSYYLVEELGQYKCLGQTRDDAAGEAFDKFAKLLGLGFPGGVKVDQLAQGGDRSAYRFPRAMLQKGNYDLSFSGLKTSAANTLAKIDDLEPHLADLCASFQEAIVDVLIAKFERLAQRFSINQVVVTGGVSANSRLREAATEWTQRSGLGLFMPPVRYCTDNAAMIGYAGISRLKRGERSQQSLGPSARSLPTDFTSLSNDE